MSSARERKETLGPIVKRAKRGSTGYVIHANGEMWTTGRHAYMCGYVMDPENIEAAIDTHEEELHALLVGNMMYRYLLEWS